MFWYCPKKINIPVDSEKALNGIDSVGSISLPTIDAADMLTSISLKNCQGRIKAEKWLKLILYFVR